MLSINIFNRFLMEGPHYNWLIARFKIFKLKQHGPKKNLVYSIGTNEETCPIFILRNLLLIFSFTVLYVASYQHYFIHYTARVFIFSFDCSRWGIAKSIRIVSLKVWDTFLRYFMETYHFIWLLFRCRSYYFFGK